MKKTEFIMILECVLRAADPGIDMVCFHGTGEKGIEIHHGDEDIIYFIPVKGLSNMSILLKAVESCVEHLRLEEMENVKLTRTAPFYSYEEWKETKEAKADMERIFRYLYHMTPIEKDYLFGKMALMLLSDSLPSKYTDND